MQARGLKFQIAFEFSRLLSTEVRCIEWKDARKKSISRSICSIALCYGLEPNESFYRSGWLKKTAWFSTWERRQNGKRREKKEWSFRRKKERQKEIFYPGAIWRSRAFQKSSPRYSCLKQHNQKARFLLFLLHLLFFLLLLLRFLLPWKRLVNGNWRRSKNGKAIHCCSQLVD